jgi:hypothetical protein
MAHPKGGNGNQFSTKHNFDQAYTHVGSKGIKFISTTGEQISAIQGIAQDKVTRTIVYMGERSRHGSVCEACWGYRIDCNQSRVGQCSEVLDQSI